MILLSYITNSLIYNCRAAGDNIFQDWLIVQTLDSHLENSLFWAGELFKTFQRGGHHRLLIVRKFDTEAFLLPFLRILLWWCHGLLRDLLRRTERLFQLYLHVFGNSICLLHVVGRRVPPCPGTGGQVHVIHLTWFGLWSADGQTLSLSPEVSGSPAMVRGWFKSFQGSTAMPSIALSWFCSAAGGCTYVEQPLLRLMVVDSDIFFA